jgi:hypothetical protein
VRVGVEHHGARAHGAFADLECALDDVPDLRKVVAMARMKRAGQVAHESGIGLARAFLPRVEHHLAVLARKPQRLPRHVVDVAVLGTVLLRLLTHRFSSTFQLSG